jgi:cell division protein FtsL
VSRLLTPALLLLVVATAEAVVLARHQGRKQFVALQALEKARDAMQEEWGQLQLEQATWGTHARIEEMARDRIGMIQPAPQSIIMMVP